MDLHKLTSDDIRGFDAGKLRETEHEIRRAMVDIRMDIYTSRNTHTAKIRGLRKSLARLLTVRGKPAQAAKKAPAQLAPKVAKAPKAEKTAKVATAKEAKAPAAAKAAKPTKAKTATKK